MEVMEIIKGITESQANMLTFAVLVLFALGDVIGGAYRKGKQRKDDLIQEALGFVQLLFIKPAIVFVAYLLLGLILPSTRMGMVMEITPSTSCNTRNEFICYL